jgi:hypothetical protein
LFGADAVGVFGGVSSGGHGFLFGSLTRRAVVVASQHRALVVAQAVPVLGGAGADSDTGGREAVGDDPGKGC